MADPFANLDAQLGAVGVPEPMVQMTPEGQKSTRFNNPYNIKYPKSGWVSEFGGELAPDGKFTMFPTPEAGVAAATHLIQRDYADKTIAQGIERFAPISENPNTPQRIAETAKALGVDPNTRIGDLPLGDFMLSQVKYESPTTINPAVWGEAANNPIKRAGAVAYQAQPQADPFADLDAQLGQVMAQPQIKAPPVIQAPAYEDPMAAQVGMIQAGPGLKEAGKLATEYAPEIGLVGGGLIGSLGGPLTIPAAGMGYAAGEMVKSAFKGQEPPTPQQDLQNLGLGMAYEAGGQGVTALASKLFAPAAGKVTEGAKSAMTWMKDKRLSYSADVANTFVGNVSQKIADWGLGGFITNSARQKTITGISEEATKLSESLGLQSLKDAGADLAQTFAGWGDMKMTYSQFNKALDSLPLDKTYSMYGLKDAIKSISKSKDDLSNESAARVVSRIYKGEKGRDIKETLLGIIDNGWEANAQDIKTLSTDIRKGGGNYITSKIRPVIDRMKEGLKDDFDFMMTPGGQDVGRLRDTADKAMTQAYRFLDDVGEKTGLVFKDFRGKWQPTLKLENYNAGMQKLFRPDYEPVLTGIKNNLIATGDDATWDSIKLAYLKDVFDSATPASGKLGERVFKPQQFLDWYKNNAPYISKVMPEHMDNINQWADISRFALKDFTRANKGGWDQVLASSGVGALGFLGGRTTEAMAVPIVFSPLAAIFTMSPKLNFLTRYATKSAMGPLGNIAAESAGLGTKIGAAQLFGGDENVPVFPGSNLSFAPNVGSR